MTALALPWWARWLFLIGTGAAVFVLGILQGERAAGEARIDYVGAQAAQTIRIVKAQEKVVVQTEIKYRDRIKTVYVKGEEIEKLVPVYVTHTDDDRYGVNAGFVCSYNAAWAGEPAGPAVESDRDPAAVPLSEIGEVDAHNAKACHAWRELAIGRTLGHPDQLGQRSEFRAQGVRDEER